MGKSTFNLVQYAYMAVCVLSGKWLSAQVVYTNLDPDVVLDEPDEMFGIDLDDDGLNDFNFFNESFTTYIPYAGDAQIKAIFVGAFDTMQNGIVGSTIYISAGPGYTYYFPFVNQPGEVIGFSKTFFNDNYQTMARTESFVSLPFVFHQGNWHPELWGYKLEDLIGIRFTDYASIQRYGWIRCSVVDSGRTLIIHDYAYELQPDQPIIAGDTVSYVEIQEHPLLVATVYGFNNNVFINLQNQTPTQITIVNIAGQTVLAKTIYNQFEVLDASGFPSGMYLVTLKANDLSLTRKIVIN